MDAQAPATLAERAFELLPDERQTILKAVIVLRDAVTDCNLPSFLSFEPTTGGISVSAGKVGYGVVDLGKGPYHWRRRPGRAELEETEGPSWRETPTKAVKDLLAVWGLS